MHVNMSYLTKLVLVLPALFVSCHGNTCVDELPDCAEYTKSACQEPYVSWAYHNCPAFCGFCHKACEDKRGDCHEYGAGMCQEPYKTWARENCAQYCGFCGRELECLYTPWADISNCTGSCVYGFKVQVRAFSLVPKDTPLAMDCDKDLYRNTTCALNGCPTPTDADLGWIPPLLPPSVDTGFRGPHTNVDPVSGSVDAGTAALG
uniref:Uncharacterized protein LOC111115328 n=1 Tax=Crassostrea virginica TaxID=6565 RepID=A0A8B8C231_CRAVI|nr:uncharacterized protein LOC111115328 [Crassostrea virginica]